MNYILLFIFFILTTNIGLFLHYSFSDKKETNIIDLFESFIIGSTFLTWLIFWLSFIFQSINLQIIFWPSLVLGSISLILNLKRISRFNLFVTRENILISIFYLIFIFFFTYIGLNFLSGENGNLVASWITIWGDWALHLANTTSFSFGNNFPPHLPIFTSHIFSYPFLSDFMSAIFVVIGVPLNYSLSIPTTIFISLSFILISCLSFEIFKNRKIAIISPILFFFNGGLGFIYYFQNSIAVKEMTKIPQYGIWWISILTSQLIPQRGFTIAFPLGLICLSRLWRIYSGDNSKKSLIYIGFLISLLPLFHMHTFLTLLFISIFVIDWRRISNWVWFLFPIILFTIFPIIYFYSGQSFQNFVHWQIGWMTQENILLFWIKNFGVMLILPIVAIIFLPKKISLATIPFWIMFFLANLFIFQPWEWDNTKIFVYWYLAASLTSAFLLIKMFSSGVFVRCLAVVLFFLAIFSGVYDSSQLLNPVNKITLFNKRQIEVAEFVKLNTLTSSIFLTADNHDNIISSLTGRKIVLGFNGWLWSYGVNYWPTKNDIEIAKRGGENSRNILRKYGVNYVLIGPIEINQNFNRNYFSSNFEKIYPPKNATSEYEIFKII